MEYYLQQSTDPKIWDRVDEFVYKNWAKVVLPDPSNKDHTISRYNGNRFHKIGADITVIFESVDRYAIASMNRILAIRESDVPTVQGGFVRNPEVVRVLQRNSLVLHEMFGENFVRKAG